MKKYWPPIRRFLKWIFLFMGGLFTFIIVFSFTTGPFWIYHWLGTSASHYDFTPTNIIMMGGTGMPSESALTRSYFAARLGNKFPEAKIFVTQPAVGGISLEESDGWKIKQELIVRGIDSSRIFLEMEGKNSREEALKVIKIFPKIIHENCVIVTSPEHMRRSILCFKKAGYKYLGGEPTFNVSGPSNLLYSDKNLGGRNIPLPEVGESIQLRYQFWNHLRYQVLCYRELVAIVWYKIRGWS
jgi:uncharacterized SAM-binding protein YcdF (DUF218 family)